MGDSPEQQCLRRVWIPIVLERVAVFLPVNEVAYTLRLVDKATAEQFRRPEFCIVRLSQPVPPHAFAWRWGRPGATRELTLAKRRQLLTAASGSVANLRIALSGAGCEPNKEIAYAAGKGGHLDVCLLLEQLGFSLGDAVEGAAAGGHLGVCQALLARPDVASSNFDCAQAAAEHGHMVVFDFIMQRSAPLPPRSDQLWSHLEAVALGCDLATLKRCTGEWQLNPSEWDDRDTRDEHLDGMYLRRILARAAGSPTPDWKAKVEWLESCGYPPTLEAFQQPGYLKRFFEKHPLLWT
ncbi:hypothetical protein GPECTOR_11g260 [Gonium pectorale]|uniref:Uncharacterized protein n=1 Tax=Gonium pectorale TaxID=33097 RepID=A0A150GR57_GONPE|nr:hypothetical protein GPECTOR_11g260 [Gonium pectorale]|eukprot:KXZ51820.1 hypothetical protein GPECTOR_11g260 [Gonium pectorale]